VTSAGSVIAVFLDGVGIGEPDPGVNPFLAAELPTLRTAFGGRVPTLDEPHVDGPGGWSFPLDAILGMDGLPQSGTGQVAALAGIDAPARFGRHFGPWTPVSLRPALSEGNLLSRGVRAGLPVAFANAYPRGWPGSLPSRRHAAPPLAALAAGVLSRDADALVRGEAVASEILNDGWRRYTGRTDIPRVDEEEAGVNLASIAAGHALTLFAHYATDGAGHRGGMEGAVQALERVDRFLSGVLAGPEPAHHAPKPVIVGFSDHGNVEDVRVGHTRNPGLGFILLPAGEPRGAEAASVLRSAFPPSGLALPELAPVILELLGVPWDSGPGSPSPMDAPTPG
jgi:2,3-bisphosphoglycerate-independent phosphoglycerate mutase